MSANPGQVIENESFRIIREEMGPHSFGDLEEPVVVRVIHATADFDFAQNLRFHPDAVRVGIGALRKGCSTITDVRMVEIGISKRLVGRVGGEVLCRIDDRAVHARADREFTTRAVAAMRELAPQMDGAVIAIGNAPTALLEVIRLVREDGIRPAVVIGVPVGFVSAVESKDELAALDTPYITALGRKGGSTVAVAVVNTLLRLAVES
jgi:precorrin-8X/cobalt-precorrin-8 methylmutase